MSRRSATLPLIVLFVIGLTLGVRADHQWGCYEFPNTSISFYNGGVGAYYNAFQ